MSDIVSGKPAGPHVPHLCTMTRPHTDEWGQTYPAGTEYATLSAGFDHFMGGEYQTVTIDGQRVTFRR